MQSSCVISCEAREAVKATVDALSALSGIGLCLNRPACLTVSFAYIIIWSDKQ